MVVRDVILADDKVAQRLARKENQRTEVTRLLMDMVEELIEEAAAQWREIDPADGDPMPLPLVRLRVEVTTPDGGRFDCENPQRFSNRFVGKVANVNDVVQFHQKRKSAATSRRADGLTDEAEAAISHLTALDTVRVEQLVREFLAAQSLTILPQNSFGDAVSQFVDKDDKHAMEMFVNESLENQVQHLLALDQDAAMEDEDEGQESLQNAMEKYRSQMEERFSQGIGRRTRGGKKRFKPKPDGWDTEFDGVWEDQPGALIHSDREDAEAGEDDEQPEPPRAGRGRGRGRGGGRAATTASTRKAATTTAKKSVVTKASRARRRLSDDDDDEDPEDIVNDDDDDETVQGHLEDLAISDEDALFVPSRSSKKPTTTRTRPAASSSARAATTSSRRGTTRVAASGRSSQTTLKFAASGSSQPASAGDGRRARKGDTAVGTGTRSTRTVRGNVRNQVSDDDDDDGDDAFEPAPARRR
jgi:double-strand break repair protein MRE11